MVKIEFLSFREPKSFAKAMNRKAYNEKL